MWQDAKVLLNDDVLEVREEKVGHGIWIHHKYNQSYIFLTSNDYEIIKANYRKE